MYPYPTPGETWKPVVNYLDKHVLKAEIMETSMRLEYVKIRVFTSLATNFIVNMPMEKFLEQYERSEG